MFVAVAWQEYAGLGGNVEFSKQELELQFNKSLFWDTVSHLFRAVFDPCISGIWMYVIIVCWGFIFEFVYSV